MPSRLMFAVAALLSACSLAKAPRPNAEQLDNRIRVRVVGRESESVLSADHFVFLTVCGPDGTRFGSRSRITIATSSEGIALGLSVNIERSADLADLAFEEVPDSVSKWTTDIVLPTGYTLCFDPGSYYVYRIVDFGKTMAADLNPEVRIGAPSKDGAQYFELQPSAGPLLKVAAMPPGWPLK